MNSVSQISINQMGVYISKVYFLYSVNNGPQLKSNESSDELEGQTYSIIPGNLGVPSGAVITLVVDVQLGKSVTAGESFIFDNTSASTANYTSSGTSLSPKITFNGIS